MNCYVPNPEYMDFLRSPGLEDFYPDFFPVIPVQGYRRSANLFDALLSHTHKVILREKLYRNVKLELTLRQVCLFWCANPKDKEDNVLFSMVQSEIIDSLSWKASYASRGITPHFFYEFCRAVRHCLIQPLWWRRNKLPLLSPHVQLASTLLLFAAKIKRISCRS